MTSRSNHLQNGLKARLNKRYLKERTTGTDCHLVPHSPFDARRVPLDGALAHGHRRLRSGQRPARESRTVGKRASALSGNRGASASKAGPLRARATDGPGFLRKEALLAASCAGTGECRYRQSAISAQPGARFTNGPVFPRSRAAGFRCHAWHTLAGDSN